VVAEREASPDILIAREAQYLERRHIHREAWLEPTALLRKSAMSTCAQMVRVEAQIRLRLSLPGPERICLQRGAGPALQPGLVR
jgi:hypothetical protein